MTKKDPIEIRLHEDAQKDARNIVDDFAARLIYQSKIIASEQGANEVQSSQIQDALDLAYRSRRGKPWRSLSTFVGGILIAASFEGMVGQLSGGSLIAMFSYALVAILGVVLTFIGLGRGIITQ